MLLFFLLAAQDLPPETQAVMDRTRRAAAQRRALERDAGGRNHSPGAAGLDSLPPQIAARLRDCLDKARANPAEAVATAGEWVKADGSTAALQCSGYAHAQAGQWDLATADFTAAADQAAREGATADAARLHGQAGNAALAGGDFPVALTAFDAALKGGDLTGLARGETCLDRARAHVALGELAPARADLDEALPLAAEDPLAWLLSATLARRMDDLPRARKDIAEAARRAPDDRSVALEQGVIALLSGDEVGARAYWNRIIAGAPASAQAETARAALARLGGSTTGGPDMPGHAPVAGR